MYPVIVEYFGSTQSSGYDRVLFISSIFYCLLRNSHQFESVICSKAVKRLFSLESYVENGALFEVRLYCFIHPTTDSHCSASDPILSQILCSYEPHFNAIKQLKMDLNKFTILQLRDLLRFVEIPMTTRIRKPQLIELAAPHLR